MDNHANPVTDDDNLFESYLQYEIDSVASPNTTSIDDEVRTKGSSTLAGTSCENFPALADAEGANPHRATLPDSLSSKRSDWDNAVAGEVHTPGIKPKGNDQRKSAEPDIANPRVEPMQNLDFEDQQLGTGQDSVCAAAVNSKESPEVVLQACEAAQGEAEKIENDSVEAAVESEHLGSAVMCPSSPHRKTCRPLQPSHDIHPIGSSPSFTPIKR